MGADRRALLAPVLVTVALLAVKPLFEGFLPAEPTPRALVFAAVGAVVLGAAGAAGYRRAELGLGPGLLVLAAGVPLLTVADGTTARRLLLGIPLGTVFFEEVLFRGVLWAVLRRAVGLRVAMAWQALAFGAWHLPGAVAAGQPTWAVFGVTVLAGAGFAWLRERSGSLVAPAVVHWTLNGVGVLLSPIDPTR